MLTIYHNPRCSKSRNCLVELEKMNTNFEIRKYLENPFDKVELETVIKKLGIKPIELIRTNEALWKENYKNKNLTDNELIDVMLLHPKLIERPIVVNENKAVIARPLEKVHIILK